ncbi:DUF2779 domain-containing protein [Amedibacillus sp. YH-ame10]
MYHLSDIKKMERCPRFFWLSRKERKDFVPFINYNENMSDLVREFLMIQDAFVGKVGDEGSLALDAFHEKKTLVNARFVYRDLRVKVPVLVQEAGVVTMYMTYRSCFPKEKEAQYIADTLSVLEKLDIHVDQVLAIHLNANYVREEDLDVKELLVVNQRLFNNKNKAHTSIYELVDECKRDIDEVIDALIACESMNEIAYERTTNCTRGLKCSFYEDCFYEDVEDTSILHLVQSAHKFTMKEEGIDDLKDVDVERIEGTRHQYAQIMAAKLGGEYVDRKALQCWIKDHITYPISYLDFEWETYAFPPYTGMKPYDVLTFQYSLHVEHAQEEELQHHGFIGEGDCREAFIKDLLANVPKNGSILVFNMEGAEKLRLVQLAQQFPQYEEELKQVWLRMVDLSLPFSTGNVYDLRMQGGYSLKTLVSVYSDYTYQDLAISYGMDAVDKWRQYHEANSEEKKEIYEQLTQYCSMDTYAEYIVYHALKELASK